MRKVLQIAMSVCVLMATLVVAAIPFHIGAMASHGQVTDHLSANAPGLWGTYLQSPGRDGFNASETAINATSAAHLKLHWTFQAGAMISVQPVEANGLTFWGSWDGIEHAIDSSGKQVWATGLGTAPPLNCIKYTTGTTSTATVSTQVIAGGPRKTVYVGGGLSMFYALDAATGTVLWHTRLSANSSAFIWSSPVVYGTTVYATTASLGDCPLIPGKVFALDARTGTVLHTFILVPKGCTGAGVWGSPTLDSATGTLYVATGNASQCTSATPLAEAVVELRASDLSLVGSWQAPPSNVPDSDFGSTPTLFQATIGGVRTPLLGVANKNGTYYVFKRDALARGPVWSVQVAVGGKCPECGDGSISPSAFDGTNLYVAAGTTTVAGQSCTSSVRAVNPASGHFRWEHCFKDGVLLGAVSAVRGVVFAGEGAHEVALDANTGSTLFHFVSSAPIYSPASIANGVVYFGNNNGTLYALGL